MSWRRDMGTNQQVMAWFMDTYSMYQGPNRLGDCDRQAGGLRRYGSVGVKQLDGASPTWSARAMDLLKIRPSSATAIIQGYGNVGSVTAGSLSQRGVKILGVSDHTAAYYDPRGINVEDLDAYVAKNRVLRGFSSELAIDPEVLLLQPCDILVPAALERAITIDNVGGPAMQNPG